MWVKKWNLQITFMYIHFSNYANPPKCIVDAVEIRKTLYFFGQWFVEIKLKKLSSFVSLWTILLQDIGIKWWLLLVPGIGLWVCKAILQHERYPFLPGLHQKMWWKEFLLHIDQTLTVSSKFGDLSWLVAKNIHSASILKSCWSWYKLIKFLHLHCSA